MKVNVLSRISTVAFDFDLISKHHKILESEIKDIFKKDSKNICPHGKMNSVILIDFNTDGKNDLTLIKSLSITFDYGGDKQLRLRLSNFGTEKEIAMLGVPTSINSRDFDKYNNILEDYSYLMNKGCSFAESDFEAADRKCSTWLRKQQKV